MRKLTHEADRARSLAFYDIGTVIMMIKMAYSTVKNDDLTWEYNKMNNRLASFRISSLWQYIVCHTYTLITKAREP
jgi:hypothetical protein